MEKKQVTREKLIDLIAKFIKESARQMGDKTNVKLPIELQNWSSGWGNNSKWSHSDIVLGRETYTFTDKEIDDAAFVSILKAAIAKSNVRAKVVYDECGDGYWCKKQTIFRRVEVFAKPCKEFNTLYKYLEKYAEFTLGETDLFDVNVCGKRSSWSDAGRYNYLCYDAARCKAILDAIKAKKASKDTLRVEVKEYFSHGDETDYDIAMYQESEWYGNRGNKLHVTITTPMGRMKLDKNYYV